MNNIYEKYWSDDALRMHQINRWKLIAMFAMILWLAYFICLSFFSDKLNMNSNHELVTFVAVTLLYIGSVIQLEVLRVIDLIKKKTKVK